MAGRHKRPSKVSFVPKAALVAAPVAVLTTASAVAVGVAVDDSAPTAPVAAPQAQNVAKAAREQVQPPSATASRAPAVSRSSVRAVQAHLTEAARVEAKAKAAAKAKAKRAEVKAEKAATAKAVAQAKDEQWTTAELNLWSAPGEDATQVGTLEKGTEVLVTGRSESGRDEVVIKGASRWVTAGYLSEDEPLTGTDGVCTNGSTIASWVNSNLKSIHQAVCARFPSVQTYGTRTGPGDHGRGKAVDIMVSGPIGWEIANYLRENYQAFGISYLIYEQKIWSVERSGEGWRGMSNRGSATANHMDHVHVSIY